METHYVDVTYSIGELAGATPTLQEMLAEVIEEMGARAAIEEVLS